MAAATHDAAGIACRWRASLLLLPRQDDRHKHRQYTMDKYSFQLEKPYWPDYKVGLPVPDASFLSRFCPRDVFSFAQANHRLRNLSSQGNSSAKIMSPGIRKTHPGMMGRINPMMPRTTRPTPIAFLRNFFTASIVDVWHGEVEPGFLAKRFALGQDPMIASVSTSPFCLRHRGIFLDQRIRA